jgi:hypothetical protein
MGVMADREDMHRLVDALPESRLPVIEQILRASLDGPVPAAPRRFSSSGTLSAERRDFLSRNPGPGPGLPAVATLDHRHFSVVRPRHVSAFTLLP